MTGADRVSHDDPTVTSYRGSLASQGRTSRLQVLLPEEVRVDSGENVRVVLDGHEHFARADRALGAEGLAFREVVDSPSLAREPGSGEDRLAEWVEAAGLADGRTVHVDEITAGFQYGLRAPGETAVYAATQPPDDGLADIARRVEDG